jgi:hypothetical protein
MQRAATFGWMDVSPVSAALHVSYQQQRLLCSTCLLCHIYLLDFYKGSVSGHRVCSECVVLLAASGVCLCAGHKASWTLCWVASGAWRVWNHPWHDGCCNEDHCVACCDVMLYVCCVWHLCCAWQSMRLSHHACHKVCCECEHQQSSACTGWLLWCGAVCYAVALKAMP